jgi:hypothetical protein
VPSFLSASQAAQLRKIAQPFKGKVKLGKPFAHWTDDELWLKVLGQIAVVGKAEPGERLQHDPTTKRRVSVARLEKIATDSGLQRYLHDVFKDLGVRYVGNSWRNDRKAAAAVKNFRKLMARGGPRRFFQQIAELKSEGEKIDALQGELKYYGDKGARDTLIEVRLAENCMALDARIYGVLKKVGVRVSPEDIFRQIERELIQKVATPLNISGAVLDRALFQNYTRILEGR